MTRLTLTADIKRISSADSVYSARLTTQVVYFPTYSCTDHMCFVPRERGNDPSRYTRGRAFLGYVNDSLLQRKDSTPLCYFLAGGLKYDAEKVIGL